MWLWGAELTVAMFAGLRGFEMARE